MNKKLALRLYNQAMLAKQQKKLGQAERLYKAALKEDSTCRGALMGLGLIYSSLESKRGLKQNRKAFDFFSRAYDIQKDAAVCFNLGSESFKLKEYKRSRDYLKECLRSDQRMLKAHLLLAYVYQTIAKFDKSAVYYQNALKISPKSRMAILGYCACLSEQGYHENALYALDRYFNSCPEAKSDLFAKKLRAGLLLQLGHLAQSYKDYAELIKHSPEFTSFSDHLSALRKESDKEYQLYFESINDKISTRIGRLRARQEKHKNIPSADLSAQENGIEGSQDLAQDCQESVRDMVDLSLLHLFKGDSLQALKYLFQAGKYRK